MKLAPIALLASFTAMPAVFAAEQDFSSPYDRNPRCTELGSDLPGVLPLPRVSMRTSA